MKIFEELGYKEIKAELLEDSYTESMQPLIGGEKIDLRLGKNDKFYMLHYAPVNNPTVSEILCYEVNEELWDKIHEVEADMSNLADYSLKLLNIACPIIERFREE